MSLRDELDRILREVLPESPEQAIWGTRLAEDLKKRGVEAPTATLTQYFSDMSRDPTSPIAKVVGRHGYYLRPRQPAEPPVVIAEPENRRASQPEEKFRSLFMRWVELEQQLPWHLEHTQAARQ